MFDSSLPIHWILGPLFPWLKRMGHEADHSPASAKVKNLVLWLHSPICLHGMQRNNSTFGSLLISLILTQFICSSFSAKRVKLYRQEHCHPFNPVQLFSLHLSSKQWGRHFKPLLVLLLLLYTHFIHKAVIHWTANFESSDTSKKLFYLLKPELKCHHCPPVARHFDRYINQVATLARHSGIMQPLKRYVWSSWYFSHNLCQYTFSPGSTI
jgi:hypothetical protein